MTYEPPAVIERVQLAAELAMRIVSGGIPPTPASVSRGRRT